MAGMSRRDAARFGAVEIALAGKTGRNATRLGLVRRGEALQVSQDTSLTGVYGLDRQV